MPWKTKKQANGKVAIVKKTNGKKVGESDSIDMANKAIAARYVNMKKKGTK